MLSISSNCLPTHLSSPPPPLFFFGGGGEVLQFQRSGGLTSTYTGSGDYINGGDRCYFNRSWNNFAREGHAEVLPSPPLRRSVRPPPTHTPARQSTNQPTTHTFTAPTRRHRLAYRRCATHFPVISAS